MVAYLFAVLAWVFVTLILISLFSTDERKYAGWVAPTLLAAIAWLVVYYFY